MPLSLTSSRAQLLWLSWSLREIRRIGPHFKGSPVRSIILFTHWPLSEQILLETRGKVQQLVGLLRACGAKYHRGSQVGTWIAALHHICLFSNFQKGRNHEPMPATAHLCAPPHLGRQTPICLRRCYSLSCCGTQSPTDWPGSSCRLLRTSSRSLESSLLLWCPWVSSSLRKAEAPPCCPIIGNTWRHGWALKILCPVKEVRHRKSCTAWFYWYEVSKIIWFIQSKSGMVASRGWWGGRNGQLFINMPGFS